MSDVVNKLWGFCHTLRHDGIDYGDYIEQLTYLLFLKMANERGINLSKMEYEENKKKVVMDCSCQPFTEKSGTDLIDAFAQIMRALSRQSGLLGDSIYEPERGERYDCILTNPPFGTKGANQAPVRDDFTVSTSNKQLNFIQHVVTILKPGGRAAMVLPDNVLFSDQAGDVFKYLMEDCNVHTVLRLPNGTFTPYSQGVKANVIFFQKGFKTENCWIYDCRTNIAGVTKKDRPLTLGMFTEFERCYGKDPNGQTKRKDLGEEGRFRKFSLSAIKERDYNLDITWLKDENLEDPNSLPEPQVLAGDAITELNACVDELQEILTLIEAEEVV